MTCLEHCSRHTITNSTQTITNLHPPSTAGTHFSSAHQQVLRALVPPRSPRHRHAKGIRRRVLWLCRAVHHQTHDFACALPTQHFLSHAHVSASHCTTAANKVLPAKAVSCESNASKQLSSGLRVPMSPPELHFKVLSSQPTSPQINAQGQQTGLAMVPDAQRRAPN